MTPKPKRLGRVHFCITHPYRFMIKGKDLLVQKWKWNKGKQIKVKEWKVHLD